jgi:hypothetical protein
MARTKRIKLGDVFILPTDEGRNGIGQVVALGEHPEYYYLAVFDDVVPEDTPVDRLLAGVESPVLFLGLSMAAKFTAGHWTVVGNRPVGSQVRLPAYKVSIGFPPAWEISDHTGTRRRPATDLEAELLPYRKVVSPMYFEVALKAHLGLEPWHEAFDALRPRGGISSSDLFGP